MKHNILDILNPENILIDNRSTKDLINYINKLSTAINYYNNNNNKDGFFSSMLSSDESFLIAEISTFEIIEINSRRLSLIKLFDNAESYSMKKNILIDYIGLANDMFFLLEDWFEKSRKNNFSFNHDSIDSDIELIIKHEGAQLFQHYKILLQILYNKKIINDQKEVFKNKFKSVIWQCKANDNPLVFEEKKDVSIIMGFKQLVMISNKLYKLIYNIINKSKHKLNSSLFSNSNHNPHVGLVLTFLKLFNYVQDDINQTCKKHLDFYYKNILSQKKRNKTQNKTHIVVEIDENLEELAINKGSSLIAGQYDDGTNIIFKTDEDTLLNNVKICYLMTIFVSRNKNIEYDSRYQLISSIFSKVIAKNNVEVQKFNSSNNLFSMLGEDQNVLTEIEQNMDFADFGFMISSPALRLGQSDRNICIELIFDSKSIRSLTDLIIDISNNSQLSEEEVFYKVFAKAFNIKYTTVNGWENIESYDFVIPDDWSTRKLTIVLNINKVKPAFSCFDNTIHQRPLSADHPIIEFTLNQNSFYNSYAFLSGMQLNRIDLNIEVKNLKNIKAFRDGQELPINSEFEFFGPIPKFGSKLHVACEELFNKKVSSFQIRWDYTNLNDIDNNLQDYYRSYGLGIDNHSFRFRVSALSDFMYSESNLSTEFSFFNDNNNLLEDEKVIKIDNTDAFIKNPNYLLPANHITHFSNDFETGLLKLEMMTPKSGFGHKIYPKLHAAQILKQSKNPDLSHDVINEPFSPKISNLTVSYNAKSSLVFNESDRFENDFDEKNNFFLISPFGLEKTFSKTKIKSDFCPNSNNSGELIIGLDSKNKFEILNILFEIEKKENSDYNFSRQVKWYYSTFDTWRELDQENILYDQTDNLVKTGTISFRFPVDLTNNNSFLEKNKYYIKATSKNKADQFGLIKSISTNSILVKEEISSDKNNTITSLNKGSIRSFESNINGVLSVHQPISSPKVKLFETDIEFYKRVSEQLRHKKRPVTRWDFQKFILNEFDWVSHAQCFESNKENKLTILCVKKIQSFQNIDEIKLSLAEINEIKYCLNKYISPFTKLEIINPIFEDLWIKCKIIFKNIQNGKGLDRLNKDLLNYICPWKNYHLGFQSIKTTIKKIDIINFIKNREYVDFLTGFSVLHLRIREDSSIEVFDSALPGFENDLIQVGSGRSIIVPRDQHKIEIISKEEYHKPSAVNFDELEINRSFLVHEKKHHISNLKKRINDSDKFDDIQFIIKN